jgi:hypothetical protein
MNKLAIPKTLIDYCEAREQSLNMLKQAYRLIDEAEDGLKPYLTHGLGYETKPRSSFEDAVKDIDRQLWRQAFDKTGFLQLMDREAKSNFDRDLDKNPPEFTEQNIRSIFLSLAQESDEMFVRGLVNVFRRLSKDHRTNTNSPFKVNDKAIISYMFESNYSGGLSVKSWTRAGEELNDLDRVIKTLDEKQHHARTLQTALNAHFYNDYSEPYEDEYYRIKGFKNGNMHLQFKRLDLLEKANKLIAKYYGDALAASAA